MSSHPPTVRKRVPWGFLVWTLPLAYVFWAPYQQRAGWFEWTVTTLTLLLAALRDHIIESEWSGTEDGPTAKRIEAYFLKNVEEEGNRRPKLARCVVFGRTIRTSLLTCGSAFVSVIRTPSLRLIESPRQ